MKTMRREKLKLRKPMAILLGLIMLFSLLPISALADGAVMPSFTTDLSTDAVNYVVGDNAAALTVEASVTDGGEITYQWYSGASDSITGGTTVGTGNSYSPSTVDAGTTYYYVIATNTLDGATSTATSAVAAITVSEEMTPDSAPAVAADQGTQTGTVTPASVDGYVPSVPYTGDASTWFVDANGDSLTYSIVSAADSAINDVSSNVTVMGSTITYTPAAAQVGATVTIVIKANDGTVDSSGNVTISLTVGTVPDSTFYDFINATYSGGYGTEATALEIDTAQELQCFAAFVNAGHDFAGKYVKLTADIDLASVCGADMNGSSVSWTPVGSTVNAFSGTFDGGGHKVSNLYINSITNMQGLFGYVKEGATQNLTVDGSITTSGSMTGGIAGQSTGSITNCLSDVDITVIGSSSTNAGGITGVTAKFYGVTITPVLKGCVSTGQINVQNTTYMSFGAISGSNYTATACYSTTSILPGASYSGTNGTLVTVDDLKTGKVMWSLNTADGTQAYSNAWTTDAQGICIGSGATYYRVRLKNLSSSVSLTFEQNSQEVTSYTDGVYTVVYVPAGTLTISPLSMTDFSFDTSSGLTKGESNYSLTVTSGTDLVCGLSTVVDNYSSQLQKIAWYTDNPSATSFTITTAEQLQGLKMLVAGDITGYAAMNFSGKTITLGGNIDLSTVCSEALGSWAPIGASSTASFSGTFNGANYMVSNLYINSSADYQGLFGYAKGAISNVTVDGIATGGANVGAVVGYSTKAVTNCLSLAAVSGSSVVGGVAGRAATATACIYYRSGATIGVAGTANTVSGCYYLADSAITGALGTVKTASQFATREMAHLIDTAAGNHASTWQMGESHPVLGSDTVSKISLTRVYEQTGKSVNLYSESIPLYTSGDTQYAYLIKGETITLKVTNNDSAYVPVFSPDTNVTSDNGTYTVTGSSTDVITSYRFAQIVSADTSWYNADSTEFTLTTEAQLRGLAALVNDSPVSFEGKTINLGNDIDIVGDDWPMIGNSTNKFFGTFDGHNHTISGFYVKITSSDKNIYMYQGFFGYVGTMSTIRNLKLDGTVGDGKYFAGILAGYADKYCTINNCVTNGTVYFTDNKQSVIYVAGMVGDLDQYGVLTDCVNNADVIVSLDTLMVNSTNFVAAGLVAYLDPYGEIKNCVNNGSISCRVGSSGSYKVSPVLGGIVGITGADIKLMDCTNNGAITSSGIISNTQTSVAGIAGSCYTATISGCRNNAKVSCSLSDSTGACRAFAGGITGGSNSTVSAISSTAYNLTVNNCVNTGEVEIICKAATNVALAGGIVGGSGIMLTAVTNCSNTGNVNVTCASGTTISGAKTGAGGIIGNAFNMNTNAKISGCSNSGTITASANNVGGIAGNTASGLVISDCYNTASVTGIDYVGGIAGNLACLLKSTFNYGGGVTAASGSHVGLVVGSGASETNTYGAYYLAGTSLTGAGTATDAAYTTSKTAEEFKTFDLSYALNSAGETTEDRCVWEQGDSYPQFVTGEASPVYTVKTAAGDNGTVTRSKQYLSEGESYTITFNPADGHILKDFTVTDISGKSYKIYLNSAQNGVYSVTMEDADGKKYNASLSKNVLTCTLNANSLTYTGEFTAETTGTATVTLSGNGGWWDDDKDKTTVTLSMNAGTLLTLAELAQPQEYRSFVGWYIDAAGTTPFNFSTAITENTTLYAKWDENSCVIYYQFDGGSWSAKSYTAVTKGTCLAEPAEIPKKNGCTFTGWYSDEECLNPFDSKNTKINGDIKLYAGWITEGYYNVIFDSNGGIFADSATRVKLIFEIGTSIGTALDVHSISNGDLTLRGWYSSANGGSKWPISELLTGDIILYAHWDKADGTPTLYSGTEESPMELEDLKQLVTLRDAVNAGNSFADGHFKMACDLTLPAGWAPIGALKSGTTATENGKNIYPFSGIFDGGGKTITVPEGGLPLFGYVREASVQNLNIYGAKIAGYGLVNNYEVDYGSDGDYYAGTGGSYAVGCPDTIVIDKVTLKSGSGTLNSGFIGGFASGANIVNIRNSAIESGVVIGYEKSSSYIGSFAGYFNGTIENCVSNGTVYGVNYIGGIISCKGQSMGYCKATNCIFGGTIVSTGNCVGGIFGGGYSSPSAPNSPCVSAQNCYVTGSITGSNYVGGILGAEPSVIQCWANGTGYIQNNYFSGTLTTTTSNGIAGGIIGYMKSLDRYNIIENNYCLSTSAQTGIGLIDAIDYTTTSYSRSETFVADEVCVPTTTDEFASGRIAALLNSGSNTSGIWTQSGNYPVPGTAATATYTVTLNIVGSGTASLTGLTTGNDTVYQNAGSNVSVSATASAGSNLAQIKVTYASGTTTDITDGKEFTMPQQNATVYVVFTAAGEKYATGIAIASQPTKTSYTVSDSFAVTGLTFTVTYSDSSTETISATSDMVSGFSSATAGTKILTLTYLGCTATFIITVSSAPSSSITVTFRLIGATLSDGDIDLGDGGYKGSEYVTWIKTTSYTLSKDSTVYDLFTKALAAAGLTSVGADSNYVKTIYAPSVLGGYELSEFTNGYRSGWMYTVNGSHPNEGLKYWTLSDGDTVIWHYVNDYSYEVADWSDDDPDYPSLGDGTYYNKWLTAKNVNPTSSDSNSSSSSGGDTSTTLTPSVTTSNGTAAVMLGTSDFSNAIASAKENNSTSIVIAPTITGSASKVTVELPKASVSSIATQTSSALTVQTPVGNLSIPNATLSSIASQAGGSSVTMSLEAVKTSSLTTAQQATVGDSPVYDISIMSGGTNISSFGGGSISISLPYMLGDDESADGVVIWYLNDGGALEQMACTYDKTTGLATFTTTHLSKYLVGYEAWTNPFGDVKSTEWFYSAVKYVSQNSLMSGTSITAFDPSANMTRAMLVTVLYRLEGKAAVTGTNSFTDVKSGEWYTDAIIWASTNGIVSGYGGGLFGTNDSVTREQLATILMNYATYKKVDVAKTAVLTAFADASGASAWASAAMQWAVAEGLITGTSTTTLSPTGTTSRAQAATILMRFGENITK